MSQEQLPIHINYKRKVVGLDFCLSFFLSKVMQEALKENPNVTAIWYQLFSKGFNALIDKRSSFTSQAMADVYMRIYVTGISDKYIDLHIITEHIQDRNSDTHILMWRPIEGTVTIDLSTEKWTWQFSVYYPTLGSLDYEIRII